MKKGENLVVILPDSGSRYMSKVFNDEWMEANDYLEEEEKP
jgi:cystathionine beta-synthase